jgi:hypothetical protein
LKSTNQLHLYKVCQTSTRKNGKYKKAAIKTAYDVAKIFI